MEKISLGRDAYFEQVIKDMSRKNVVEVYYLPMCGRCPKYISKW